jgi:hypothetical protein
VVLDVADDLGHVFEGFGHCLFPRVGISHDTGDVTLIVAGSEDGPGGVEIDLLGRAAGVIRAQDGLERRRAIG